MSPRTITLNDSLYRYLIETGIRETELLAQLRTETATMANANMQIAPEQGQFMAFLVETLAAKRIAEIGTFTGYATLCMANVLPAKGHIDTCDLNPETTAVARRYWQKGGVGDRISLHLAPALETLNRLLANGAGGSYDLIFIDADKENYDNYYELGLSLLRTGGLILIDNVLWHGNVADQTKNDAATLAIRALNAKVHKDERVSLSMLPVGDGLTLVRKRAPE